MRKIYASSWNLLTLTAEAYRVLGQLVMLLTVFFHWMYKMKFSCYQGSSFIHEWFVYWVFGWEMRRLSKSKSYFEWHGFCFPPCLMRKRVAKSRAFLALLYSCQELHLEWKAWVIFVSDVFFVCLVLFCFVLFWFFLISWSRTYRIYSINRPGRLLNFWTLWVGAYSRWALIQFSAFSASVVCLLCNKTRNGDDKTRRCNKARFL